MQEFKSKVGSSLRTFLLLTISFLALCYFLLVLTINFKLPQITFPEWLVIVLIYSTLAYIYAGFTNNNILVFENRLEIVNRLPLFKKHHSFQFDQIKSVKFKHEWTETFGKNIKPSFLKYIMTEFLTTFIFPTDFKWIRVSAVKDYKFYCFGIEMDYYDNKGPLFEDLYKKLAAAGVAVSWTDTTNLYYSQMTPNTENTKQQP